MGRICFRSFCFVCAVARWVNEFQDEASPPEDSTKREEKEKEKETVKEEGKEETKSEAETSGRANWSFCLIFV